MKVTIATVALLCLTASLPNSVNAQFGASNGSNLGAGGFGTPAERHGPDYRHASTAYEGAVSAHARYLHAAGQYNYNTAMAARHYQYASEHALRNDRARVENFFAKRELNKEHTARPNVTTEDIRRINADKRPNRLNDRQNNAAAGEFHFPTGLVQVSTEQERNFVADLFRQRSYDDVNATAIQDRITRCLAVWRERVKGEAGNMPPQEHIAAVKFLRSLAYEASLPAEPTS